MRLDPYVLEFILAILAVVGGLLVASEARRLGRRYTRVFFLAFVIAPMWFVVAYYVYFTWGNPDWVINQPMKVIVRLPLLTQLYILYWGLRRVGSP
jgi:hypothetical protein